MKDCLKGFLLISILATVTNLSSQSKHLSSPRQAIITHFKFLQPEFHNDSLAALPFIRRTSSSKEAINYAVKLKYTLDGRGEFLYMEEIPNAPNFYDSALHKHIYYLLHDNTKLYLLRDELGDWYYSESSIHEIDKLYNETYKFGTGILLKAIPQLGTGKLFGLYTYQYITILVFIIVSFLIYFIVAYATDWLIKMLIKRTRNEKQVPRKSIWAIAKPTSVLVIIFLLTLFVPVLQLPPRYAHYIIMGLKILMPLFVMIILYRVINIASVYMVRFAETTESTLDDQLVPLIRKSLKFLVLVVGTLVILDNLDVPILPLLTGLSIGGLAFALAAQDTLKNFFGSIMIFIDKPFQVGDWISTKELDGVVEEVGLRSSRVRTFRDSVVYVPNGKLADNTVDNHGLRKFRRFYTQIAVTYDTPPQLLELFIEGLRKIVQRNPLVRQDNYHIFFNEMASSSLNIMFYIFFEVRTWSEELKARHETLLEIMLLAKELGVDFAFPTQTLHLEKTSSDASEKQTSFSLGEAEKRLDNFLHEGKKDTPTK